VNEKNEKNDALLALLKEWRERPNTCTQEESDAYDRMLEEMRQERDYRYTREDMERAWDSACKLTYEACADYCDQGTCVGVTLPPNPYKQDVVEKT
jgi:hypothetical protein